MVAAETERIGHLAHAWLGPAATLARSYAEAGTQTGPEADPNHRCCGRSGAGRLRVRVADGASGDRGRTNQWSVTPTATQARHATVPVSQLGYESLPGRADPCGFWSRGRIGPRCVALRLWERGQLAKGARHLALVHASGVSSKATNLKRLRQVMLRRMGDASLTTELGAFAVPAARLRGRQPGDHLAGPAGTGAFDRAPSRCCLCASAAGGA